MIMPLNGQPRLHDTGPVHHPAQANGHHIQHAGNAGQQEYRGYPVATNISTALILGISSIGVIKSNMDKKKIKCACLGDVFNLPMSTVTIVEDLSMVGMSLIMLFQYQIL